MKDVTPLPRDLSHLKTARKDNLMPNEYGGIFDKSKKPIVSFIKARMNKDNFWNLMFFIVMVSGVGLAFATGIMILSWFTIAGSIWLVKRNSNIAFNKDKLEFIINNNKNLKAAGGELIILTFLSFGLITIIGLILDGLKINGSPLILATMTSLLVLIPVLYCILRNFPIAVYFKKEAWIDYGSKSSYRFGGYKEHEYNRTFSKRNTRDIIGNPAYRYMSCNIHYRR